MHIEVHGELVSTAYFAAGAVPVTAWAHVEPAVTGPSTADEANFRFNNLGSRSHMATAPTTPTNAPANSTAAANPSLQHLHLDLQAPPAANAPAAQAAGLERWVLNCLEIGLSRKAQA